MKLNTLKLKEEIKEMCFITPSNCFVSFVLFVVNKIESVRKESN